MNSEPGSKIRTSIVKIPDATPGLLFINGQQKQFVLEGVWRSAVAPAANMTVDAELDATGAIKSITVVDSQQLNKEHMEKLSAAASEQARHAAELAKKGIFTLAEKMGWLALSATVLLWIAFFLLPSITVGVIGGTESFSFWSLLGFDIGHPETIAAGGTHGIWAFVAIAALIAPLAVPYIKFSWARYLYAAPAGYILLTCVIFWWDINQAMSDARKSMGDVSSEAAAAMIKGMSDLYSISWGAYILGIAAAALLVNALITKSGNPPPLSTPHN